MDCHYNEVTLTWRVAIHSTFTLKKKKPTRRVDVILLWVFTDISFIAFSVIPLAYVERVVFVSEMYTIGVSKAGWWREYSLHNNVLCCK